MRVINKLMAEEEDLSNAGNLIEEGKELMRGFSSCTAFHIRREGNCVAHDLAKFGSGYVTTNVWMDECPSFIENIVSFDVIGIFP
ncbi:hypothetical protein PTKIN_Ptkin01aG0105500 [Pterospermum kingtungense]